MMYEICFHSMIQTYRSFKITESGTTDFLGCDFLSVLIMARNGAVFNILDVKKQHNVETQVTGCSRSTAGRSGLAVVCVTAVREVLGLNHAAGSCVYRKNHQDRKSVV